MLARSLRLRQNRDIVRVLKRGRSWRTANLKIYVLSSRIAGPRTSVVISKKVDKRATVRNRNRRRVVEIVREMYPNLQVHFDILIYINTNLEGVKPAALQDEILGGLKRLGVVNH